MAKQKYTDFQQWIEESNLSEDDLQYLESKLRTRTILWFLLSGTYIAVPLFIATWLRYKQIKQRTFNPRLGFFFSLCNLCMYITFIMIIPLIVFLIATNTDLGTGIQALSKKGLIGDGKKSIVCRQIWEKIRKKSRLVRILVCAGIALLLGFALSTVSDEALNMEYLIIDFIGFDILGIIVCCIVNNIRYRRQLSSIVLEDTI